MTNNVQRMMELREEFQECENSLSFVVDVTTSNVELSERGRLGFTEFGITSVRRLSAAVAKLSDYAEGSLPS